MWSMRTFTRGTLLAVLLLTLSKAAQGRHGFNATRELQHLLHRITLNPGDGRRIMLDMPHYRSCMLGTSGMLSLDGKHYFSILSNDFDAAIIDPHHQEKQNKTYTWVEARNACRRKCMELVTLDDPVKNENLLRLLKGKDKAGVWTGGKRCLFSECYGLPEPHHLNGWYWSPSRKLLHPAHQVQPEWPENPWAQNGVLGIPQPDNAEHFKDESVVEACLAIKTTHEVQKPAWHDQLCDRKLGAVCEANPELSEYTMKEFFHHIEESLPPQ